MVPFFHSSPPQGGRCVDGGLLPLIETVAHLAYLCQYSARRFAVSGHTFTLRYIQIGQNLVRVLRFYLRLLRMRVLFCTWEAQEPQSRPYERRKASRNES